MITTKLACYLYTFEKKYFNPRTTNRTNAILKQLIY